MAKRARKRGRGIFIKTGPSAVRALRRDVNVLKSNIDTKFFDSTVDDAVVSATGQVNSQIFTVPDGDNKSQKDGLKITIKSIQIRFQLNLPSTTVVADARDICRFILVRDRQTNGALPAVTDILAQADIQALKELEQSGRFLTLLDKTVYINSMGGFGDGTTNATLPSTKSFQFFKKMNLPIIYNDSATTGAIATIVTNNLVLLYISEATI